jgi:hypothetical protein
VVRTDGLPETFDAADLERQCCDDPAEWLNERLISAREFCSGAQSKALRGSSAQQQCAMLMLPQPSAPIAVARRFVERCCLHNGAADALTVRYWCGSWWTWRTTHWIEAQPHAMKSLLYAFTADAVYIDAEGKVKPWSPTRNKISACSKR